MNDQKPASVVEKQRIFNIPRIVLATVGLCILCYSVPEFFFSSQNLEQYYLYFAFVPAFFTQMPLTFLYTLVSHSFLHAGISHLANNMIWLIIFGSPLASRLGNIRFLCFWCFTAAIAALTYYFVHADSIIPLVGASGAISGIMGGAARFGFHRSYTEEYQQGSVFNGPMLSIVQSLTNRTVISFIGFWFIANLVVGLAFSSPFGEGPAIAWEAHIGGMVAGFLLIGLFEKKRH